MRGKFVRKLYRHFSGKNAAFLRLVRCRSIEQEFNPTTAKTAEIGK